MDYKGISLRGIKSKGELDLAKRYKVYENTSNGHREKVKDGFNWLVFFFGPLWYLFNSMFGKGIFWILLAVFVGGYTFGIGGMIVWIIAGAKANKEKENKYLQKGWKYVGYEDELITQTTPEKSE